VSPDERQETPAREIRVEGVGLLVLVGAVVVLMGAAFFGGVWVGRSTSPGSSTTALGAAPEGAVEPAPEAAPPGNYFDRVQGTEKSAEPQRQVSPPPRSVVGLAGEASPPAASPGTYFVQVFAGRDRSTADAVVKSVTERGYRVRVDTSREGADTLYKVRVGGYVTQDEARAAAERLKKEGESGAWVTQVR